MYKDRFILLLEQLCLLVAFVYNSYSYSVGLADIYIYIYIYICSILYMNRFIWGMIHLLIILYYIISFTLCAEI